MEKLKKALVVTGIIFFVVATFAVVLLLSENTNFLKSKTNLACEIDDRNLDFTLAISKRSNTVDWQGGDNKTERTLEYMNDSSLRMSWRTDDNKEVLFTLNRLTGRFNIDLDTNDDGSLYYGRCYEATQKF